MRRQHCPTCGERVWHFQPDVFRCVNGHLSHRDERDNTGRKLATLDTGEPVVLRPSRRDRYTLPAVTGLVGLIVGYLLSVPL